MPGNVLGAQTAVPGELPRNLTEALDVYHDVCLCTGWTEDCVGDGHCTAAVSMDV